MPNLSRKELKFIESRQSAMFDKPKRKRRSPKIDDGVFSESWFQGKYGRIIVLKPGFYLFEGKRV
jgi:hypothetical protein